MSKASPHGPSSGPPQNPQLQWVKDEEEGFYHYLPGGFHPVHVNEIFNNQYIMINKLGWGRYYTVWLVQDFFTSAEKKWAMKILSAECYGTSYNIYALEILKHLREGDIKHPGYQHISHLQHSFTHKGPNGDHVCLILKAMCEGLSTFRDWFNERKIPTPVVQRFTKQLLLALDFAHERGVIHMDIQPSNIMIHVPDEIPDYALLHATPPEIISSDSGECNIIRTQSLREICFKQGYKLMNLNIALSGWGASSFTNRHITEKIQPQLLHAPEVLLKAPWDEKVDIWNLGALIPELVFGFSAKDKKGAYSVGRHLEEMAALCGPFPKSLLEKGDQSVVNKVFDAEGGLKVKELEQVVGLEKRFEGMDVKERSKFVAFTKRMLVLDPEQRPSAKELLDDEWLKHDYD